MSSLSVSTKQDKMLYSKRDNFKNGSFFLERTTKALPQILLEEKNRKASAGPVFWVETGRKKTTIQLQTTKNHLTNSMPLQTQATKG